MEEKEADCKFINVLKESSMKEQIECVVNESNAVITTIHASKNFAIENILKNTDVE